MVLPTFPAGRRVRASELATLSTELGKLLAAAPSESKDSAVTDGSTTSTSFTNTLTTTGIRGVAFVAGESGRAEVLWMCTGRNSVAGGFTITQFEVRAGAVVGSGTVVWAADENVSTALQSDSAGQQVGHTGFGEVTGLTEGTSYNVCIVYRVTANTGTFNRRRISIKNV